MYNSGYPTANIKWQADQSGANSTTLYSAAKDGLNVPFAFVLAERGVPGEIYFGGAAELTPILGASTFDPSSAYFNSATQYIATAMAGQATEVMRLVDPAATTANMGLFISVTPTPITQYEVDATGSRIYDVHGDPIPQTNSSGVPVTQPGIKVLWSARPLLSTETFNALTVKTVTNSDASVTTTYPIMGFLVNSPGVYGNRQGFSLYSTGTANATLAQGINSVLYRFAPIELPTGVSTTASGISDKFGSLYNDVSFKNVAVYQPTATNYAFNYVLGTDYVDANNINTLPYTTFVYGTNVGIVGALVVADSPELNGIDPYMIDLISGQDLSGNYYHHLEIDINSSTVVNPAVVNYANGGSDGQTTFAMLETLVQTWLSGSDHGEFPNLQQHPMTHFSDPGFSMPTKILLLNMLSWRDNFKIDLATQDISLAPNTEAQDMSAGQALSFRAQMFPESIITGVGCTRVGVYAHCANLISGGPYSSIVPLNLNRLIQRRDLNGGQYITGSAAGIPNSAVTIFAKPNWVADSDAIRALSWANSLNVVSHADRTTIYYASLRTVYPNDTSLLSDDEISDYICYLFKICRQVYATYAGVRGPKNKLFPLIQADINNLCAAAFSGTDFNVNATVLQTAADANLGYAISVNLNVTSDMPMRQLNFNVIVGRAAA